MTALQLVGDGVAGAPVVPVIEVFRGMPEVPRWHVGIAWAYGIYDESTKAVVLSWDSIDHPATLPSQRWDVIEADTFSLISPPFDWPERDGFFDRLLDGDTLTVQINHDLRTRENFDTAGFSEVFAPIEDSRQA